jgi:cell division transport system ATP-binding protein
VDLPVGIKDATIYQGKIPVLTGVDFQLQKGEFAYLIGKTGSGKSSLLKTLYGELPLLSGQAIVAGFDLQTMKSGQIPYLRRKLGIVFQDFQLLSDRSALDNMLFVLKATGWKDKQLRLNRAAEVLAQVGLQNKDYKIPAQLSGGEQQRLVIARALLNNPEVILADEPTGNLDPDVSDEVLTVLHEICKQGKSVIMATHDYRLIDKFGGSIYRVADGKIQKINGLDELRSPA